MSRHPRPSTRAVKVGTAGAALISIVVVLTVAALREMTPGRPSARAGLRQDTPEAAYHSFYVAVTEGDEAAIRRLTLPLPDDAFAWLLKGAHLTREEAEAFHRSVMKEKVLKRLKAGDALTLPGGQVITIRPGQVGEGRAVLVPEGSAIPTDLRRVDGDWMVDARPFIAGRKAAEVAKRKSGP